jgi:GMP synthase-like glutamine amidotransferase
VQRRPEVTAMIVVVSMQKRDDYDRSDGYTGLKVRFEKLAGCPVLNLHYSEVSPEMIARVEARAVFVCGFGYPWSDVPMADLYGLSDFLHETEVPVYAACGGHQLVGFCFNVDVRKTKELYDQPMRKMRRGEPDYGPICGNPGHYVASGYQEVEIVQRDPVFRGLRRKFRVLEAHYCEVKKLPPGFELLASSPECRIEMMKHRELPIYGAQFHAENWVEPYLDGRTIMANFFRIAGLIG